MGAPQPPLIAHVINRLDTGGLENGLINVINRMPANRYRHAVICLDGYTGFRERLKRSDVPVFALGKRSGHDPRLHLRLWRTLRSLRPAIAHTRNLPTLECQIVAAAAGVRHRIHGEHGRDVYDLNGTRLRYTVLRRTMRPFVHRYVAVSEELECWLVDRVGVAPRAIVRIQNGVDADRFRPDGPAAIGSDLPAFTRPQHVVIGAVGRLAAVKDQITLVRAFIQLIAAEPSLASIARLAIVGDGLLRSRCIAMLSEAGLSDAAWLPGMRDDVPAVLRSLDIFVLPSIAEGLSNTILEAMATGLPVVATDVGGNHQLVEAGQTGLLVPPSDETAMARAIRNYVLDPAMRAAHGAAGRRKAVAAFGLQRMVDRYVELYDGLLQQPSVGGARRRVVEVS